MPNDAIDEVTLESEFCKGEFCRGKNNPRWFVAPPEADTRILTRVLAIGTGILISWKYIAPHVIG